MATASGAGRKSIFITGGASGIGLGAAERGVRDRDHALPPRPA